MIHCILGRRQRTEKSNVELKFRNSYLAKAIQLHHGQRVCSLHKLNAESTCVFGTHSTVQQNELEVDEIVCKLKTMNCEIPTKPLHSRNKHKSD